MSTLSKIMDSNSPWAFGGLMSLTIGVGLIYAGALGRLWYLILAGSWVFGSLGLLAVKGNNAWDHSQIGIQRLIFELGNKRTSEGNRCIRNEDL